MKKVFNNPLRNPCSEEKASLSKILKLHSVYYKASYAFMQQLSQINLTHQAKHRDMSFLLSVSSTSLATRNRLMLVKSSMPVVRANVTAES